MCRWLAYSGAPIYLDEVITHSEHSLIDQSLSSLQSETTTNGDGFGIGWYGQRDVPGVFKSILPAWNDTNLQALLHQIESPLFLAHVRAATGTEVQRSNCHPFRHGKWLFVHNGIIGGFDQIRRDLMLAISPELFGEIKGTTDSEVMFYLALTFGLQRDVREGVAGMVRLVEKIGRERGIEHPVQMSLGISDGQSVFAFRYSTEGRSRTLYHSASIAAIAEIAPQVRRFSPDARAVVSEPLSDLAEAWIEVPESSFVTIRAGEVRIEPFEPREPAV